MSRFGKLPVTVVANTEISSGEGRFQVKGPKGTLSRVLPEGISIVVKDNEALVEARSQVRTLRALQGTIKSHLSNMITGVSTGWNKQLEIVGAGYRAEVKGRDLVMQIGYSHPVTIVAPENITFKVEKAIVTVEGIDREVVGHIASLVRAARVPEPYKGTGIKYTDEIIKRKAGKQAAK